METIFYIVLLFFLALLLAAVVLPIVALVISIKTKNRVGRQISCLGQLPPDAAAAGQNLHLLNALQQLQMRVANLEARIYHLPQEPPRPVEQPAPIPTDRQPPITPESPITQQPPPRPAPETVFTPHSTGPHIDALQLESMIGRRWLGWAAVGLILFAAAFFLKYAFDNRWIGELGRVSVGVVSGVTLSILGFRYHQRGWRVFSQILTSGGVVLLYLSVYAAFGYYHLVTQRAAFVFLVIVVIEAAGLALLYQAPAIAIMALIGGFLSPLLLHSDRDQYGSLFGYILALDVGALAVLKQWAGLSSLAFVGTHLLFWIWYDERYHPDKLPVVMIFQTAVFLAFFIAYIFRQLLTRSGSTFENLSLLLLNPFVFFATSYHLLNPSYHDWMGVFAMGLAVLYAATTKLLLDRSAANQIDALILIGVAITFVTLAIPIQLRSNWITMTWAIEALAVLWAGIETRMKRLHVLAAVLFTLALGKLILWDTIRLTRPEFIPVFNRYFLSSLFVIACLFGAAWLYQRIESTEPLADKLKLVAAFVAVVALWFLMTVEVQTYFTTRAEVAEDARRERWLGQMAVSVLWAVYAAVLATIGFVRQSASVRWAALGLFGIAIVKAMIVDIAYLQQLYRIIVFFVLGVLLLIVAWAYHRAFYAKETAK